MFCAHLTVRVGHRPYLPPLLPQRPCWPRLPPATKPLPAGAAPGPVPPALPRASHTATARPPPPTQGSGRATPGPRLQPPGAGGEAAPPAGCGPGRAAPSCRRAWSGDGGRAAAPPAAPSRRWQRRSAWGRYPWRSPGRGRVERGAGTGRELRGSAAVARDRGGRSEGL